jgi:hypothetical protein
VVGMFKRVSGLQRAVKERCQQSTIIGVRIGFAAVRKCLHEVNTAVRVRAIVLQPCVNAVDGGPFPAVVA